MSFRETSAWISLLSILAVFGFYFTDVALALKAGRSIRKTFSDSISAASCCS